MKASEAKTFITKLQAINPRVPNYLEEEAFSEVVEQTGCGCWSGLDLVGRVWLSPVAVISEALPEF